MNDVIPLTRQQVRAAFRRHHGEAARLARQLGVFPSNITDWFNGVGRSKRVDIAVRKRAAELIAAEQLDKESVA